MHWVDIAILVVITLSMLVSMLRGFVREALSLAGWVAAIWIALQFSPALADFMATWITLPSLRFMAAFCILFVATLVLAALVNSVISRTVRSSALKGTDRALGALFGSLRGMAMVIVLVWLAGFTKFPQSVDWKQSFLVGYFQTVTHWMRGAMPPEWAAKLKNE